MVNIKCVMECNWLQMKPVKLNQHWYQSTCSDPWRKQLHKNIRVTLNKNLLQKETHSNNPKWPKHKKHISPEGKQLLRKKVEEVMSYNSSKLQPSSKQIGESSRLSRKERRARFYICRKRGHVYWKCISKERSTKIQEPNMPSPVMTEVQKINYPERVHVTTDYIVEGSDKGNWDNIWYVSSAYKRHMSPMKHLFKRMIQRFRVEGTKEKEKKFLISYGVGEAFVETNEGRITISNVLFTPEVTLNILSIDQLEEKGYMVNYVNNRCKIKYMFDEMLEAVEQEATIEGEDEVSIIKSHNSFLNGYFRSLDLNEECSLI
ncbi:hypothetical protein Tco_1012769, partial [Tanacetum coccineum]